MSTISAFTNTSVKLGLMFFALLCAEVPIHSQMQLTKAFSLNDSELPTKNGFLVAFDVSPDGKTLAAIFNAAEGEQSGATRIASIFAAEWDIRAKKVIAQQRVEGPALGAKLLPNPQYRLEIRFTPDGGKLVVQTGMHIQVLEAPHLQRIYSIPLPENSNPADVTIRGFSISGDGRWLAVLSNTANYACQPTDTRLFKLDSGDKIAEWNLPQACSKSVSLSRDGGTVLLGRFDSSWPPSADVLLVESRTGKVLRSVDAGYGGHSGGYGVNDAQFIDNGHFVTLSNISLWSRSSLALHTLKIWDAATGRLIHELRYSVYGIVGDSLAVAAKAPIVAAITNEGNPEKIGRDDDTNVGFPRLLLFHLNDDEPFYISPGLNRPVLAFSGHVFTSPVRLSAGGDVVALMEGRTVEVYETPRAVAERR